jgi:hypothetical protein|tara:strand:+ start:87 stop:368 length:282 start_codon:yes stop_codon:yes gene_type:complete
MARYKNASILKDKNGKRYYRPTIVRGIPLRDSDKFIYPRDGDRLDTLAQQHYGDSNLWWIIAKANSINNGSIGLKPEKRIRIPTEIQSILDSV